MKIVSSIITILLTLAVISCKKETPPKSDLQMLRESGNEGTYTAKHLDSAQVIKTITNQKLQEVLDLSVLYTNGRKKSKIDSLIYEQISSYFYQPDSLTLTTVFNKIDSLGIKQVKVKDLDLYKLPVAESDSLDTAEFYLEYTDKEDKVSVTGPYSAQYILQSVPMKFQKEFRFYFINFFSKLQKNKTDSGVTSASKRTSSTE